MTKLMLPLQKLLTRRRLFGFGLGSALVAPQIALAGGIYNPAAPGLADPGGNGVVVRTALNTTVARTITGTSGEIVVNDGSGVAGNPTIDIGADIAQLTVADQVVTGGARITTLDLGNLSGTTITPDPGDRPIQKITNNGAGTIAPGTNQGAYLLVVKNTTGAGAITTSGWQDVSGEAFDTTTTSEFLCHCTVVGDFSAMVINKVA